MSIKQAILKTLEENKKLTTLKEIYEFIKSYFLAELKSKTTKSTIYTNKIKREILEFCNNILQNNKSIYQYCKNKNIPIYTKE